MREIATPQCVGSEAHPPFLCPAAASLSVDPAAGGIRVATQCHVPRPPRSSARLRLRVPFAGRVRQPWILSHTSQRHAAASAPGLTLGRRTEP